LADSPVTRLAIEDAAAGTPGLGGAVRVAGSPYARGHDPYDVVPLYLYEGRWLFAHGTAVGVHLLGQENEGVTLDALARYRFWELEPDDQAEFDGLDKRRQTVDGGLAARVRGAWGEIAVEWLADLLDRHGGSEIEASYRYRFDWNRWSLSPYLSFSWLDEELTAYYFGVTEREGRPDRAPYSPSRAFNLGYGLNVTYRLGEHTELFGNLGLVELDAAIFDSPLVDEAVLPTAFIGGNYLFGSVRQPAVGASLDRQSEWSWRFNFGYQAQGNIVGDIDQGDFRRSLDADTRIAGFTVSKLLNDGPRMDFYGRLAVFRHFEGGAQRDFQSTAVYVMTMGNGYFPWSEQPSFRWGFGMGFSYAAEVPIVEQIKQTRRDRNTTRLLNYLEMTLDFPIARRRSGPFGNCYAGLTIVHRSGIFATSNLLGDVGGGSDWITGHLECIR
jgi:outer membrane protein